MNELSSLSASERFFNAWRQLRRGEILRGTNPLFQKLTDPPLSGGESDMLQALVFRPEGVPMNELATLIFSDPGNTTRAIEQMVAKGLARRFKASGDGRVRRVRLTRAGWLLGRRHIALRAEVFEAAMRPLSGKQRVEFIDNLEAVIRGIQAFVEARQGSEST
jgi:DNA-binding MarR family transcriptional regulator